MHHIFIRARQSAILALIVAGLACANANPTSAIGASLQGASDSANKVTSPTHRGRRLHPRISRRVRENNRVINAATAAVDQTEATLLTLPSLSIDRAAPLLGRTSGLVRTAAKRLAARQRMLPRRAYAAGLAALGLARRVLAIPQRIVQVQPAAPNARSSQYRATPVGCMDGQPSATVLWGMGIDNINTAVTALADQSGSLESYVYDPLDRTDESGLDPTGATTDAFSSLDDAVGGAPEVDPCALPVPAATSRACVPDFPCDPLPPGAPPVTPPPVSKPRFTIVFGSCYRGINTPIETITFNYRLTARGGSYSFCDPIPRGVIIVRIHRTCLQSGPATGGIVPDPFGPWRTRKCHSAPEIVTGAVRRTFNVNWYCRKTRDWRTRLHYRLYANGIKQVDVTKYSLANTLYC